MDIKETRVPEVADPVEDLSQRVREYDSAMAALATEKANTEALERQLQKSMDRLNEAKNRVVACRVRVVHAAGSVRQ